MGKKLIIYMIEGNEVGPRTIEIGNWTGKAIYSARFSIDGVINREEFNRPGIYFLKSPSENDVFIEKIYVGEAENIRKRLKQHLSDSGKDFTELIAFMSKDEHLTKAHIKYIESQVVNLAKEAKSAEIENGTEPSLPTLPEADISDMEYFIEQIKLILSVVGFRFLIPTTIKSNQNNIKSHEFQTAPDIKVYKLKSPSLKADMYETENGYIVRAGSQCNKNVSPAISKGWINIREKLKSAGILIDKGDFYQFTEDTVFNSTSAASSVILGRQSAGPIEWIDNTGKTYKQNQEEQYSE